MSFMDTVKEKASSLETKYYYIAGGIAAVIIVLIVILVALSGFPGARFGDWTHGGAIAHLKFNKSGSLLASSELNQQAKAFLWDVASRKRLQEAEGAFAKPHPREKPLPAG